MKELSKKRSFRKCLAWLSIWALLATTVFSSWTGNTVKAESTSNGITFETISDTLKTDSIETTKNASTNLGSVSNKQTGFEFQLTRPGISASGQIKIGLWNTSENNVWSNGYILVVQPRSEEGKLGWAMRKGDGEGLFSFGDLTDITGDTVIVRTWQTDVNEETGAHTIHVSINDTEIFTSNMGGDLLTGCYMAAYDEVSVSMVFSSVVRIEKEYETISDTAGVDSIEATKNASTNLGSVSDKQTVFAFQLTRPGTSASGQIKIGLWNTAENNVWSNGYILVVQPRSEEGKLGWAMRKGDGEGLFSFGDLTDITGDTVIVRTWQTDVNEETGAHTIHVSINDTEIFTSNMGGDLLTGCYMAAYNEVSVPMVFSSVKEEEPKKELELPEGVIFDNLAQESISATKGTSIDLGKAISTEHGFRFKVTRPDEGQMKIGLYNTSNANPWAGGYTLLLAKGTNAKSVNWNIAGKNESGNDVTSFPNEQLQNVSDEMEIYAWLSEVNGTKAINVIVDGTRILTDGLTDNNAGLAPTFGTYMSIYNEQETAPTVAELAETDAMPDSSISFEDLGMMKGQNSMTLASGANAIGQVSSVATGFQFKLTRPTSGKMKFGLYNTIADAWTGGYLLQLDGGSNSVKWTLYYNGEEKLTYGEVKGTAEDMQITVWMDAQKKFHAIIDGKKIVTAVDLAEVGDTNTYMNVYSECSSPTTVYVKTIKRIADVPPAEIVFDNLAKESISATKGAGIDLGKTVNTGHGFRFKVTRPDEGQMKIGLYNTSKANPWADGYVLLLAKGSISGAVGWNVRSGANESAWAAWGDEVTDVTDEMEVYVWLSDVDDTKKLNVIIGGKRVITDGAAENGSSCGDVTIGTYMSIYNEQETAPTVEELAETDAVPDSSISFEDLGMMKGQNSMTLASGANAIGQVSSVATGFQFKLTRPTSGKMKFGLYNTIADAWTGGYLLQLDGGSNSVKWTLYYNGEEKLTYGEVKGTAEDMQITVWMDAQKKFHAIIDGKKIVTAVDLAEVGDANTYMNVYNECSAPATVYVKTIASVSHEFTFQKINEKSGYSTAYSAWKIYLNTDKNIVGNLGAAYPCKVKIDGTEYDVTLTKESVEAGNLICVTIDSGKIPQSPTKDYEVVLSAQDMAYGDYAIQLTADYTFYVRSDNKVLNVTWPYAENSDILGDCNGDGKTNSKDLVRLKKYLAGKALVNNQADLTIADSAIIDEKDVNVLRKVLLDLAVKTESYVASGEPVYNDADEMRISAFMGPRSSGKSDYSVTYGKTSSGIYSYNNDIKSVTATKVDDDFLNEEEFAQFADAGFNTVIAEIDSAYALGGDTTANKKYLDLAKAANVDVIFTASYLADYLRGNASAQSEEKVKQELSALMSDLGAYENFAGIQMADEITTDALTKYADVSDFVKDTLGYNDTMLFTNLSYWTGDTLTNLMQNIGTKNGIYEYGFYPFQKTRDKKAFQTTNSWTNVFKQEDWFTYLSGAATSAKENGVAQLGLTVQSSGYEHPVSIADPSRRDISSKADIGFQVYTGLAYGVKSFNYFTYWEHYAQSANEYYTSAMVLYPEDGSGKSVKTKTYDYVKAVNDELKQFDHVLLDYEWKGSINVGSVPGVGTSYTVDSNSRISSVTNTAGQAVIGCMKDSEGFDGFMIANADNPEGGSNATGTITFNNATRAIVYVNGVRSEVTLNNGAYTWNVPVGEGVFVIPLVK